VTDRRTGSPELTIEWAVGSHRGRVREQNEDSARVSKDLGLAVLCDGMGGHQAGEVASRIAVETFLESYQRAVESCAPDPSRLPEISCLLECARRANESVHLRSEEDEDYRGMGCTLVALKVAGGGASFVSVGDSRLYLFRGGKLTQVSEDHTRVRMLERMGIPLEANEARQMHGLLVRALGTHEKVDIDHGHGGTYRGDTWLLCSDGLTDELGDAEIARILQESPTPQSAVTSLIERAVQAGGRDNVTIAIAKVVGGPGPPANAEPPRPETELAEGNDTDQPGP
jgi:protein phosphatase